jgi:hypothetical protein
MDYSLELLYPFVSFAFHHLSYSYQMLAVHLGQVMRVPMTDQKQKGQRILDAPFRRS